MTTPNQPIPDNTPASQGLGEGAFVVGGGETDYGQGIDTNFVKQLFELPAATLGNMLSILEQALLRLPMSALQAFKAIVPDWVEDGVETVATVVGKIIAALDPRKIPQYVEDFLHWVETVFKPVSDLVTSMFNTIIPALSGAVDDVISFVMGIVNAIIQGIRGIPLFGNGIANVLEGLTGAVKTQQVQAQNFTISSFGSTNRNPTWICRYPVADVSYPEFFNLQLEVHGDTSGASSGTAHTHAIDPNNATAGASLIAVIRNEGRGALITVSNTTVYDTLAVSMSSDTTDVRPTHVYIDVFREDDAGQWALVAGTGNIASVIPLYSAGGAQFFEVALSTPIIAQSGERYMVRLRNASTTNVRFLVRALTQTNDAVDMGLYFRAAVVAADKTSYTGSEVASALADTFSGTQVLLFAMLASKNLAQPDVSYSDDFNRANLGPYWSTSGAGALAISVGRATYGGTTDGDEVGLYIRRTTDDASRVDGNIYVDDPATTQRLGLMLHANRGLSQYVYLSVTGTDAKIYSYVSGTLTQRATVSAGGTDVYTLQYDEVNDKYVALKAGVEFGLQWSSVGSSVAHGSNYRFGGIRITRASGINAGTIDNFTLADYA